MKERRNGSEDCQWADRHHCGGGRAFLLYYALNKLAEALPLKWEERVKPLVFIVPALLAIALFLMYPAIRTIIL